MLILTQEQMKQVMSMKEAIAAAEEALRLYTQGESQVPLRTSLDIPKSRGNTLFMPAYVGGIHATGIKTVSTFPKNAHQGKPSIFATMLLVDAQDGRGICLMDGTYLTQLRTGAVSGAATKALSRKDSRVMALFGTGGQARAQLEGVLSVRPIQEVRVYGLDADKAKQFAHDMEKEFASFDLTVRAVSDPQTAIIGADIITTATTASNPVFDSADLKKGAHINGVGSYTPDRRELDERLLLRADRLYLDTKDGVFQEAGDLILPLQAGKLKEQDITGELGELLLGQTLGRKSQEEITVFKTVGSAVLDVVTAYRIYEAEAAQAKSLGTEIPL